MPETSVALTNVRVVDGTGAPPREDQTIVIAERHDHQRRARPRRRKVPAGARTIDLTGHTVIPGLVGMHNHTFYTTRGRSVQLQFSAPRLYLGRGVTTDPHDRRHLAVSRDQHEDAGSIAARFPGRACTSPVRI